LLEETIVDTEKKLDEAGEPEIDKEIDLNLVATFPASDPPSWTLGHDHDPKEPGEDPSADS
jgi:hypothetical protein